jgi:hypothetical protein
LACVSIFGALGRRSQIDEFLDEAVLGDLAGP